MSLKECQNQFAGRRWNCSTHFEQASGLSYLKHLPEPMAQISKNQNAYSILPSNQPNNRKPPLSSNSSSKNATLQQRGKKSVLAARMNFTTSTTAMGKNRTNETSTRIGLTTTGFQSDKPIDDVGDVFGGVLKYREF